MKNYFCCFRYLFRRPSSLQTQQLSSPHLEDYQPLFGSPIASSKTTPKKVNFIISYSGSTSFDDDDLEVANLTKNQRNLFSSFHESPLGKEASDVIESDLEPIPASNTHKSLLESTSIYLPESPIPEVYADNHKVYNEVISALNESVDREIKFLVISSLKNVNIRNHSKDTLMHYAAKYERLDIIEILQSFGAIMNAQNINGETPLYMAIKNGSYKVAHKLIDDGADLSILTNSKNSLLHIACEKGSVGIVQHLISKSIDMNVVNQFGETAAHLAFKSMQDKTPREAESYRLALALLIEHGANMKIKNAHDNTVFHLISSHHDDELQQLCLDVDHTVITELEPEYYYKLNLDFSSVPKSKTRFWDNVKERLQTFETIHNRS